MGVVRWTERHPQAPVERLVLTGMVVSDEALRELRELYKPGLLSAPFADTVAGWCAEHWDLYKQAPGRDIESVYQTRKKDLEEGERDALERFLNRLSEEFDHAPRFNAERCVQEGETYLRLRGVAVLQEQLQDDVSAGDLAGAETTLAEFKRVERLQTGVEPLTDEDILRKAFEEVENDLFKMGYALGELLHGQLQRGNFLAIQSPEKRGKTWMLQELGVKALQSRCNVAIVTCGDMTDTQMVRRLAMRYTGHNTQYKYCEPHYVPCLDCVLNQDNSCTLKRRVCSVGLLGEPEEEGEEPRTPEPGGEHPDYSPCTACRKTNGGPSRYKPAHWYEYRGKVKVLSPAASRRAFDHIAKHTPGARLKLVEYPSDTLTPSMLDNLLRRWEDFDGFVPDVLIVDYVDIMAPDTAYGDFRHDENGKWKGLRRIAQEWRCLVITASQADAASYKQARQSMGNFSEDKRKNAHVTGMLALNQTEEEKERRILRIAWTLLREGDAQVRRDVTVLQDLWQGKPHLASYW